MLLTVEKKMSVSVKRWLDRVFRFYKMPVASCRRPVRAAHVRCVPFPGDFTRAKPLAAREPDRAVSAGRPGQNKGKVFRRINLKVVLGETSLAQHHS